MGVLSLNRMIVADHLSGLDGGQDPHIAADANPDSNKTHIVTRRRSDAA
jgi:hypothetical protein